MAQAAVHRIRPYSGNLFSGKCSSPVGRGRGEDQTPGNIISILDGVVTTTYNFYTRVHFATTPYNVLK